MKKILFSLFIIGIIVGCETSKVKNMTVSGTITGMKKGTLYLQKYVDTLLVNIDSVNVDGQSEYFLTDDVDSPEVYFISLSNLPDEKISFFGEEGEIIINSKLDKFSFSTEISGSANQTLYDEYMEMMQKFNGQQLDIIKAKFEAQKEDNDSLFQKFEKDEQSLLRRKYYFSTNFAVINADHEVAPYLALTELFNANIKLLDTINNSLSINVKKSKYGLELQEFIDDIKKKEKK
jgi:hypothetical protein